MVVCEAECSGGVAGARFAIEGALPGGSKAAGFCAVWQAQAARIARSKPPSRTLIFATRILIYEIRIALYESPAILPKNRTPRCGVGQRRKAGQTRYFGNGVQ